MSSETVRDKIVRIIFLSHSWHLFWKVDCDIALIDFHVVLSFVYLGLIYEGIHKVWTRSWWILYGFGILSHILGRCNIIVFMKFLIDLAKFTWLNFRMKFRLLLFRSLLLCQVIVCSFESSIFNMDAFKDFSFVPCVTHICVRIVLSCRLKMKFRYFLKIYTIKRVIWIVDELRRVNWISNFGMPLFVVARWVHRLSLYRFSFLLEPWIDLANYFHSVVSVRFETFGQVFITPGWYLFSHLEFFHVKLRLFMNCSVSIRWFNDCTVEHRIIAVDLTWRGEVIHWIS